MNLHWIALLLAGLMESLIPWLVLRSESYTHWVYTPLLIVVVVLSILGLRKAMAFIPVGVAYSTWTALGVMGSVLIGIGILDERLSTVEMFSLLLILLGVVGLRIATVSIESSRS